VSLPTQGIACLVDPGLPQKSEEVDGACESQLNAMHRRLGQKLFVWRPNEIKTGKKN